MNETNYKRFEMEVSGQMKRYSFGSYPQNDGRETITWLMLEKNGNEAKLIFEYVLDAGSFNRAGENVWEESSLRESSFCRIS